MKNNRILGKKQVTDKLNQMFNVQLIQSRVCTEESQSLHNNTLIDQLDIFEGHKQCLQGHTQRLYTESIHYKDYDKQDRNDKFNRNSLAFKNSENMSPPSSSILENKKLSKYDCLKQQQQQPIPKNSNEILYQIKRESMFIRQKTYKNKLSSNPTCNSTTSLSTIINFNTINEKEKDKDKDKDKENKKDISELYKKSIVIKMQNYILSQLPNCPQCSTPMNFITKDYQLKCNNCTNSSFQQTKNETKFPLIGLLFSLETIQSDKKLQTNCQQLLKQIIQQINKIQSYLLKLQILKKKIQIINNIKKQINQEIITKKQQLIGLFKDNQNGNNSTQLFIAKIRNIIPQKYFQEISVWEKVHPQEYTLPTKIQELLNKQLPFFMKQPTPNIFPILQTLTNNFSYCPKSNAERSLTLSISTPIELSCLSLNSVKFIVDGSYNIPQLQHIKKLQLQFQGKRTYRQLSLMLQKIPETVQQISMKYDHKINSHISGQQYPLLSKLCSMKLCKKLYIQIHNIKDWQNDLLQMSRVLSKKKEFTLIVKKCVYSISQKKQEDYSNNSQIIESLDNAIISNIIKKIGKGIVKLYLDLPIAINRDKLYSSIILGGYSKLYTLKISLGQQQEQRNPEKILKKMIRQKKIIVYCLKKHPLKKILTNKVIRKAVLGIIIGD